MPGGYSRALGCGPVREGLAAEDALVQFAQLGSGVGA
jgi:hypothetical protein